MKICEIELSEKEIELLKKCYNTHFCYECDCNGNCVVEFLYCRVDSTKYSKFDFFRAFDEFFFQWRNNYV